jgi:hypothetical protein
VNEARSDHRAHGSSVAPGAPSEVGGVAPGAPSEVGGASIRAPSIWLVAVVAAFARIVGAALVWAAGFRVVSDDDFARVVLAQKFASAPQLDPTGTSWLPLPFWATGGAMMLFGSSLAVARVIAVVTAAGSGALVAVVAVAAGLRPRRACAAAIVAALMPWGMQLAVATVPEVPAAACAAAAAITLASPRPGLRLVGGAAMLASTLSRYDAWPAAFAFAVLTGIDATRTSRGRTTFAFASLLAIAGPVAWTVYQHVAFDDAFRYLGLVRSYRRALGPGPSLLARLLGYPAGILEEMREVLGAGLVALACWCARFRQLRSAQRAERLRQLRSAPRAVDLFAPGALDLDWRRPLGLALLQLVVLVAGDVRDGAPTHHPERALLGPATVVLFVAADVVFATLEGLRSAVRRRVLGLLAATALFGWIGLRLHRSLRWYEGAPRPREVEAGATLRRVVGGEARILVDTRDLPGGAIDYGYYAVLAAFGDPGRVVVDRDQDPRRPRGPSSFDAEDQLAARLAEVEASAVLVWTEARAERAERFGLRRVAEEPSSREEPRWRILVRPSASTSSASTRASEEVDALTR